MEKEVSLVERAFLFKNPSVEQEIGEITRVASLYSPDNIEVFVDSFVRKAKNTTLSELSEDQWGMLENTDSFDIEIGDWDKVKEHTDYYNSTTGTNRSWENLKLKMENKEDLDAPIILSHEGKLHLVSGNTRLMVARAAGVVPQVLIVEI